MMHSVAAHRRLARLRHHAARSFPGGGFDNALLAGAADCSALHLATGRAAADQSVEFGAGGPAGDVVVWRDRSLARRVLREDKVDFVAQVNGIHTYESTQNRMITSLLLEVVELWLFK